MDKVVRDRLEKYHIELSDIKKIISEYKDFYNEINEHFGQNS